MEQTSVKECMPPGWSQNKEHWENSLRFLENGKKVWPSFWHGHVQKNICNKALETKARIVQRFSEIRGSGGRVLPLGKSAQSDFLWAETKGFQIPCWSNSQWAIIPFQAIEWHSQSTWRQPTPKVSCLKFQLGCCFNNGSKPPNEGPEPYCFQVHSKLSQNIAKDVRMKFPAVVHLNSCRTCQMQ